MHVCALSGPQEGVGAMSGSSRTPLAVTQKLLELSCTVGPDELHHSCTGCGLSRGRMGNGMIRGGIGNWEGGGKEDNCILSTQS